MQKAYLGSKAHAKLSEKLLGRRRIYYCGTQLPRHLVRMVQLHPRRAARHYSCCAGRGCDLAAEQDDSFPYTVGLATWVVA